MFESLARLSFTCVMSFWPELQCCTTSSSRNDFGNNELKRKLRFLLLPKLVEFGVDRRTLVLQPENIRIHNQNVARRGMIGFLLRHLCSKIKGWPTEAIPWT